MPDGFNRPAGTGEKLTKKPPPSKNEFLREPDWSARLSAVLQDCNTDGDSSGIQQIFRQIEKGAVGSLESNPGGGLPFVTHHRNTYNIAKPFDGFYIAFWNKYRYNFVVYFLNFDSNL